MFKVKTLNTGTIVEPKHFTIWGEESHQLALHYCQSWVGIFKTN